MDDAKYRSEMKALLEELERAAHANPYDPYIYNSVIDRICILSVRRFFRRLLSKLC